MQKFALLFNCFSDLFTEVKICCWNLVSHILWMVVVEIKSEEEKFPRVYFNYCLNPVTVWNQPLNGHAAQI